MTKRILVPTFLSALIVSTGCLYSPTHESVIPTKDSAIPFEGVSTARSEVAISAATRATGAFEEVVVFETNSAAEFAGAEVVPAVHWRPLCSAGGGWETFLRARDPQLSGSLISYDDPSISGFDGRTCVTEHILASDWVGALYECASADSPVVRVRARAGGTGPSAIRGDVFIDDPSDADDLACVQTIFGSLTIDDGVIEDLVLPSLEEVTGDVYLVFERNAVDLYADPEEIALPELTTVNGSVEVITPLPAGAGGQIISVDFGMPNLVSLGGDLSITVDAFNSHPHGFASLAHIPGNLVYDSGTADGSAGALLPALVSVAGNLVVEFGNGTQTHHFNALETVGGDATITNGTWASVAASSTMFDSLIDVAGTLRVVDVFFAGFPDRAFDSLASAGELDWDSGGSFDGIGAAAVSLGGLRLNDINALVDLTSSMAKCTLATDAPIVITNNTNLPECAAIA